MIDVSRRIPAVADRRRAVMTVLALTTALCGASVAIAQTPEAAPAGATTPDTMEGGEGDIIVTAQRREQRLSEVPISIQALTSETLSRSNITDSRSIERIAPSVSFNENYSPSASSVSLRGVTSNAVEGGLQPSVNVVVDGVPTARAAEFITNLSDIDRIEVLSGPQGTLFGKNSTAGVISIVTKRPEHTPGGYAEGTVTTDKQAILRAAANVPVGEKLAVRVNGYFDYLDPLVNNLYPGANDSHGQRAYGIQGKVLYDVASGTDVLLTANYNHNRSSFGQTFLVVPNSGPLGDFQQANYGAINYGRTHQARTNHDGSSLNYATSYAFTGELNSDLGSGFKLTSITGYRHFRNDNNNDVDQGPFGGTVTDDNVLTRNPNPNGYPIEAFSPPDFQTEIFKYWSQEVRLAYSNDGLDAILGGFYQHYREDRFADYAFLFGGSFYSRDIVQSELRDNTAAIFGDVTYKIVPTISLFGGLRYTSEKLKLDYADTGITGAYDAAINVITLFPTRQTTGPRERRTENDLSGRLGVQWRPTSDLNYYASFNRGYKGPAADISHGAAAVPYGDRLIKPEIATSYEIGAKQRFFDNILTVDFALYTAKIRDIQQVGAVPGNITQRLINAGDLKSKGGEATVRVRATRQLTLEGNLAYVDAKYRGGQFLCNTSQTPGTAPCTIDADGNGVADSQSLNGRRAIDVPKVKYVLSANYDGELNSRVDFFGRVSFLGRSKIQYGLAGSPFTREPSSHQLDASIGITTKDGLWEVTVFGKNLTNELFYTQLSSNDQFIGQELGYVGRDFKRYGGIKLRRSF